MTIAITNLELWRRHHPELDFIIVDMVHDSTVLDAAVRCVAMLVEKVLPVCMSEGAIIPVVNDKLSIDCNFYTHWGVKPKQEELLALGVPERFIA